MHDRLAVTDAKKRTSDASFRVPPGNEAFRIESYIVEACYFK